MARQDDAVNAPCWAWWRTGIDKDHHRCMLTGDHMGLCECCCGAKAASATRTVPKQGPPPSGQMRG